MGKRKSSSKPQQKKKREPLDTMFNCLFCNHEKSVMCNFDKQNLIGSLRCKVCGVSHNCKINVLSAPIDIYSDWIDRSEDVKDLAGRASEPLGQAEVDPEAADYDD